MAGCGGAKPFLTSTVDQVASYSVAQGGSVCVVQPEDISYNGKINVDSGERIGRRVALSAERAERVPLIVKSLEECAQQNINYSLMPRLLQYQNRYVGFSGNADRISVKVELKDAKSQDELNGFFITTQSNFNSLLWEYVDSKPDKLLGGDFDEAVLALLDGREVSAPGTR